MLYVLYCKYIMIYQSITLLHLTPRGPAHHPQRPRLYYIARRPHIPEERDSLIPMYSDQLHEAR